MISLGPQQAQAADIIMDWYINNEDKQIFVLAGYAGTGKTTLAKFLSAQLENRVQFGAYTGKAVNILREKGCVNVDTIHTLLYKPVGHDKTKLHDMKRGLALAEDWGYDSRTTPH